MQEIVGMRGPPRPNPRHKSHTQNESTLASALFRRSDSRRGEALDGSISMVEKVPRCGSADRPRQLDGVGRRKREGGMGVPDCGACDCAPTKRLYLCGRRAPTAAFGQRAGRGMACWLPPGHALARAGSADRRSLYESARVEAVSEEACLLSVPCVLMLTPRARGNPTREHAPTSHSGPLLADENAGRFPSSWYVAAREGLKEVRLTPISCRPVC